MNWLAIDIGGANIKLADGLGFAVAREFAMWKDHQRLAVELQSAIAAAPPCARLAVTMTGELADCFRSKTEGVRYILAAVQDAAAGRPAYCYLVDGQLVPTSTAAASPLLAAATNWHALAAYCGRFAMGESALLIDIGSTTVDIVPLCDGRVANRAATDLDRLAVGELVYTGLERSPVCALTQSLPYRGQRCPVAQEVFATMRDVHLLTGNLPEDPNDHNTADRQAATCAAAHRRMARMLCADQDQIALDLVRHWADEIAASQMHLLVQAARKVLVHCQQPPTTVVATGHGQQLTRQLLEQLEWSGTIVSLDQQLGLTVSRCATAHALATLAIEKNELRDREKPDATE